VASVSASHLILFIASMLVAASVAGILTQSVDRLGGALQDQGLRLSEDIGTDVEIISDSGSGTVYDDTSDVVTVHVKNTGSETLAARSDAVDVFVNGRYETDVSVTLLAGASSWRPGEVVRLEVDRSDNPLSADEDHRVKVVVNGDEEVFEFRT
jgi:flagellar protein FlaG